jgi:hypothetical protein
MWQKVHQVTIKETSSAEFSKKFAVNSPRKISESVFRICLLKIQRFGKTAPHLFHGIADIKSRVNYVVPRSSPIAARLPFRPSLPPRKLVKKLRDLVGLEKVREGGRHEVWKTSDAEYGNTAAPRRSWPRFTSEHLAPGRRRYVSRRILTRVVARTRILEKSREAAVAFLVFPRNSLSQPNQDTAVPPAAGRTRLAL